MGCDVQDLPDRRGTNSGPKGEAHYRWNKGPMLSSHGYVKVRVGVGHPCADPNGYAYEHLLVWLDAGLPKPGHSEVLHHINEDKTDNRLSNLRLVNRGLHIIEEHEIERDPCTGRFVGKSKAGRLLDGVVHDACPTADV